MWSLLNGKELKRGRMIIGYGLNSLNFEKRGMQIEGHPQEIILTRKIFRRYSKELTQSLLITEIKTRGRRAIFYSITPLGVCQLFQNSLYSDDLTERELERIWVILLRFSSDKGDRSFGPKSNYQKILHFLKNYSQGEFKLLVSDIVKVYRDNSLELIFHLSDDIHFRIASIQFYGNEIILDESSRGKPNYRQLTVEQFHEYIAEFILFSIINGAIYHDNSSLQEFKSELFKKRKYLNKIVIKKMERIFMILLPQINQMITFHSNLQKSQV